MNAAAAAASLPPGVSEALRLVSEHAAAAMVPARWLVGGSCGLLLQGVAVAKPPRDIDLYADREMSYSLHAALRRYATEEPHFSTTDMYRSTLSHYEVAGHTVELVAGFEVETAGCLYTVDADLLLQYAAERELGNARIALMPLAHELLFNVLRGRPDRYEAIAAVIRSAPELHEPALSALLARGSWSPRMLAIITTLVEGGTP